MRQRQRQKKAEVLSVPEREEVCEMDYVIVACIFKNEEHFSGGPVVQNRLPMLGTVSCPGWDDPVWHGGTKPERHHR